MLIIFFSIWKNLQALTCNCTYGEKFHCSCRPGPNGKCGSFIYSFQSKQPQWKNFGKNFGKMGSGPVSTFLSSEEEKTINFGCHIKRKTPPLPQVKIMKTKVSLENSIVPFESKINLWYGKLMKDVLIVGKKNSDYMNLCEEWTQASKDFPLSWTKRLHYQIVLP